MKLPYKSHGNFDVFIKNPGKDELGELSLNFNLMIENIKKLMNEVIEEKKIVEEKERSISETMTAMEQQKTHFDNSVELILINMEQFANGDLNVKLDITSQDSIGKLFAGFNKSVSKIRELVKQINITASRTSQATQDISLSTEQLASGTEEQTAQTVDIASPVEQKTITIGETSKNANLAAASEEQSTAAQQISNNLEGIRSISETSSENVGNVALKADELKDVTINLQELINSFKIDETENSKFNYSVKSKTKNELISY